MSQLKGFQFLAINAPYQLFRYGMNWQNQYQDQASSIQEWEKTEPGSLAAVMRAYAYVTPLIATNTRFTIEHIKRIHQLCTQHVQLRTVNLSQPIVQSYAGIFRGFGSWVGTLFGCYGLSKANATPEGLRELLKADYFLDCHCETPYQKPITQIESIEKELNYTDHFFLVSGFRAGFTWNDLNELQDNIERENKIISDQNQSVAPPARFTSNERALLTKTIDSEMNRWRANFTLKGF